MCSCDTGLQAFRIYDIISMLPNTPTVCIASLRDLPYISRTFVIAIPVVPQINTVIYYHMEIAGYGRK